MLWKLKRKLLSRLSELLRNCSDAINEYLWRDAEVVFKAVEQMRAVDVAEGSEQIEKIVKEIASAGGVPPKYWQRHQRKPLAR